MTHNAALGARLGLSGVLVFKDASGAVLKTVDMTGSVPLSDTGLTVEQAQALIANQSATQAAGQEQPQ